MSASPVSPKRSEDDAMDSPSGEHHSSPNPQVTDAATPVPQDDDAVDSPAEPVAVLDDMFADDDEVPVAPQAASYASSVSGLHVPGQASTSHSVSNSRSQSHTPAVRADSPTSNSRSPSIAPNPLEYEEQEYDAPMPQEQIIADMQLPKIPTLASTDKQQWVMRLPEAVTIQPRPYHPDVYRSDVYAQQEDEDAAAQTPKEKRALALKRLNEVNNTVRWRWQSGSGGVSARRSNARIVRWSDGSSSLQVGGEFWEVDSDVILPGGKPFSGVPPSTAEERTLAASQNTTIKVEADKGRPHGISLLLANDPSNQVVVGQAIVTGELSLIPSGPEAIKRQQRVQIAMDSTVKRAGIKTWNDTSGVDPEQAQMQRERERRKGKAAPRVQPTWSVRASTGRSGGGGVGRKSGGGGGGGRRATRGNSFSGSDEDGDGAAPVGMYGGSGYQADGFVVSDEDDEYGRRKSKKSKASKRRNRDFDSDDEDEDAEGEEEEEEEEMDLEETPEPMTELERAEAAAEEVERQRRKARNEEKKNRTPKGKAPKSEAVINEDAMDLDSDEDMETRAAPTQKRVLQFEEEDEDDSDDE